MVTYAIAADGAWVRPDSLDTATWERIKASYSIGDFRMPCCPSPAIPKTSINGVQFFAHHTDECVTSPESVWHLSTKDRIVTELERLGVRALLERPVRGAGGNLKSDVYFEFGQRKIAIEVQHSYQTLSEYRKRQAKYNACQIENYWLLYKPRFMTFIKAVIQHRYRNEFGGKFPAGGFMPCLPDLPVAFYEPENEGGMICGADFFKSPVASWLQSIRAGSFRMIDGNWRIA
jgi:competence protein CoiA